VDTELILAKKNDNTAIKMVNFKEKEIIIPCAVISGRRNHFLTVTFLTLKILHVPLREKSAFALSTLILKFPRIRCVRVEGAAGWRNGACWNERTSLAAAPRFRVILPIVGA
jgi:hypothetical protein